MTGYFRRNEKEWRGRANREAELERRRVEEKSEKERQQIKLNFLLTQTELYTHFMSKKMGELAAQEGSGGAPVKTTEDANDDSAKAAALRAVKQQREHLDKFDSDLPQAKRVTVAADDSSRRRTGGVVTNTAYVCH
jgi:DNA helicase INO80